MTTEPLFPITFDEMIPPLKPEQGCPRYRLGCTCGRCQARYVQEHAHSCTYGKPPARGPQG